MTVIAGQGDVVLQAQANGMQAAAKLDLSVQSASAFVDWAAAKKITLSTAAGANVTIEGGNITVQCPGKIAIKAASRSFVGPAPEHYLLPQAPRSSCKSCLLNAMKEGAPGVLV